MKKLFEWAIAIIIALVLLFIVRTFLFIGYIVDGDSMINNEIRNICNK